MPEIRFPEFRDQMAPTLYPFNDSATLTSTTQQTIDRDMFLDAGLHPIGVAGPYLYISSIEIAPREVTITFADSTREDRAFAVFDPLAATEMIPVTDTVGRPAGVLVASIPSIPRFTAWPIGRHTFLPTATQLVPSCVIPTPEVGVRGLVLDTADLFTDDVVIVGENGVVVRQDGESTIRIDVVGDPLFRRKLCDPIELFSVPRFVKTINGCPPDPNSNYNLTVGGNITDATILRVYKSEAGLVLEAVGKTV